MSDDTNLLTAIETASDATIHLVFKALKRRVELQKKNDEWSEDFVHDVCDLVHSVDPSVRNSDTTFMKCIREVPNTNVWRFGYGVWLSMHLLATFAVTPLFFIFFLVAVYTLQRRFPCPDCRDHFDNQLNADPPTRRTHPASTMGITRSDIDALIGALQASDMAAVEKTMAKMLKALEGKRLTEQIVSAGKTMTVSVAFIWTVDFHNAVNMRKAQNDGYPPATITVVDAIGMYYGRTMSSCQRSCGAI